MGHFRAFALTLSSAVALSSHVEGSAFAEILLNGQSELAFADVIDDPIVDVSLWLDVNGSTDGFFDSFSGWSRFRGQFHSTAGSWISPEESAGQTNDTNGSPDNWEGRRAPALAPIPGGTGGGFRFIFDPLSGNAQPYSLLDSGRTLAGAGPVPIEGLQALTTFGGFLQDRNDRIEVFRARLDLSGISTETVKVSFDAEQFAVVIDEDFTIERAVTGTTELRSGLIIVPAPGTVALVGLAAVGTRRRRDQS